jgi:hypothetical protein
MDKYFAEIKGNNNVFVTNQGFLKNEFISFPEKSINILKNLMISQYSSISQII